MADEILGNCYELITEIAIADYGTSAQKGEKIFTQETPIGIGIIPDLVIGKSVHQPKILVQVHHTKAESASQKKFWRNIGEYVDGRLALGMNVQIITITFDSGQKRKLSEAALKLMDGFVEVDREPYGPGLISFASLLESHFKRHKLSQEERLAHARNELIKSAQSINEFRQLANNLDVLFAKKSKAGASWFKVYSQHQKSRPPGRIPERKLTTLRRALGRFLPVDDESLLRSLLKSVRTNGIASWPQYFIDVGIAKKTLTGSRFINPCPTGTTIPRKMEGDPQYEVYRMTELFNDNMIIDLWKNIRSTTQSLSQACEAIKSSNDFLLYQHFLLTGCRDGVQTMIVNLVMRYPCQNIDFKMLKYLSYNPFAIMFMVLGVIWFNFKLIISTPSKVFRKIIVSTLKRFFL